MKITDILNSEMVLPELKGNTKPDVLHELAGYLASKHREIDAAALSAVLAERERLSSAPDAAEIYRLIKEEDARH